MNVTVTPATDGYALAGELTIYAAEQLKTDLLMRLQPGQPLALDLAEVSEIDTAGLQALLLARRVAGSLRLTRMPPGVAEVLARLGLDALGGHADAAGAEATA